MDNIVYQSIDSKYSYIFVRDLNTYHREWLCSVSPTNNHGHATFDFASLSSCEQLVAGATHKSENHLDLVLTNVPGIIEINIFLPVGSSDHSLLSCIVSTAAHIPNVFVFAMCFLNRELIGVVSVMMLKTSIGIYKTNRRIKSFNKPT